jgi:phage shock protein A
MENEIDSLTGLDSAGAKEYILSFLSTLKLTEKELENVKDEAAKWASRANLAREQGKDELLQLALAECEKIEAKRIKLEAEAEELKIRIRNLKHQYAILPSRERSIDPDLLEQELLILAGRMPGEEKEAERDRAFEKLEKEASADAALEALKAKMGK